MAYTIFPENISDIKKIGFDKEITDDIINLFLYMKTVYDVPTPINIDKNIPKKVNVARSYQALTNIKKIEDKSGIKVIKIKFGNGSSGNRGVNNRGNLFEPLFASALEEYRSFDDTKISKDMLAAIQDLDSIYGIRESKRFDVAVVGGENTRRPLKYSPIELSNPGSGYDIGAAVTDVTMTLDNGPVYLSLKLGGTTTFFNSGIKKIFTKREIQSGKITNKNGVAMLKMLGIDNERFCEVFNQKTGFAKTKIFKGSINTNAKIDRKGLERLLQSGIGYGYHIIHKMRNKILSKKMDKYAMQAASKIKSGVVIYYGGKTGKAKRVDIEFSTNTYKFKINIRDTQGTDGYPTRMMCDFNYL